jgi:small subunit ribosomal protein S20
MPITQSAKKALRQSLRRRAKNLVKKEAYKTAIKNFKKSPSAENLSRLYKALDKAAKTNVIKKNKASRLKSRISKLLTAIPNR